MNDTCILVSSSDRTRDVFDIVFRDSARIWKNCAWPRYVGFTSQAVPDTFGFTPIFAHGESTWRGELSQQIGSLPPHIDFILLLLDDFLLLSKVSDDQLAPIVEQMRERDLSYVRLVPPGRNALGAIIEFFARVFSRQKLRKLSASEPYYSSLQAAIWRRGYLQSLLNQPGSIWDFEHAVGDVPHYAVWHRVLDYRHVVERGKWLPCALTLLGPRLDLAKRPSHSLRYRLKLFRQKTVFFLVGHLSLRLRRYLRLRLWHP